jgi:hypothetical protein
MEDNNRKVFVGIRLDADTVEETERLAKEFGLNKSEVLRLAIDDNLEKYLANVRYIDESQGKAIATRLSEIGNQIIRVNDSIRRIGVNFNMFVKKVNSNQMNLLYKQEKILSKEELESIAEQYQSIADEFSEVMDHVQ